MRIFFEKVLIQLFFVTAASNAPPSNHKELSANKLNVEKQNNRNQQTDLFCLRF